MLKSELISNIQKKHKNLSQNDIELITNLFFKKITKSLNEDNNIEIRGFGTFKKKVNKSKLVRNPKTNEKILKKETLSNVAPYFHQEIYYFLLLWDMKSLKFIKNLKFQYFQLVMNYLSQDKKLKEYGIKFIFAGTQKDDSSKLHTVMQFPNMEALQAFKDDKELTEKRKEAGAVIETAVMTPISDEHLANYPDAYIKN